MDDIETFFCDSMALDDTIRIGQAIATCIKPMTVVGLTGTLGAGKTFLVQSVAEALGVDRRTVVSPSFSLIQVYKGRIPLVHIDAWRIRDEDEFVELGIDELLESPCLAMIEWAEKFAIMLPVDRLGISIEVLDGQSRRFHFSWPDNSTVAATLGKALKTSLAEWTTVRSLR